MSDRTDLSIRTTEGIVRRVDLMTRELELLADAGVLRLVVLPGSRVLLNGERVKLRLLQPQDRVAVVVNATPAELAELRDSGCFEAVQFHGDETPADCGAAGFPRWMRAVRVKAARDGRRDSEVIEDAVRRDLGLDVLERLWSRNDMDEDEAMTLALEAQHNSRDR